MEPIDKALEDDLASKLSKSMSKNYEHRKSRTEAKSQKTTTSSVEQELVSGLDHMSVAKHDKEKKMKASSRDPRANIIEKLKTQHLNDEEILGMKKDMQKIAAKNRMKEF